MGEKDLTQKILEDYNDIFADIVNVLVFNGENRVKQDELKNALVHSQYKDETGKLHEQERDIAKYWMNNNIEIAICGLENQMKTLKEMPLRIYGYEGASYRSQLGSKNIIPVITLVLYFGEEHWNYSKNLKDLFTIPKGLEDYVNDIKINVFEISWLTDEQIELFTSDFKVVAKFFVEKRKNKDYKPDDKTTITHVDEVLKLLSAMTGDSRYEKLLLNKKGLNTMCDVASRLVESGKAEGIIEGIIEGKAEGIIEGSIKTRILTLLEFGKNKEDCISDIMTNYNLTPEEANAYFEKYKTEKI